MIILKLIVIILSILVLEFMLKFALSNIIEFLANKIDNNIKIDIDQ